MKSLHQLVLRRSERLAFPLATYPGMSLAHVTVRDVVNNPEAQVEIQSALRERYNAPFVLSAMDLSAEAEAFGCTLHLQDNDVPSVDSDAVIRVILATLSGCSGFALNGV